MPQTPPVVLTIAGFDPSSGAGITADIKTIAANGCYGVACATALTVQSTQAVRRVEPVSPETISETLAELIADVDVAAVHIGMLGTVGAVETVGAFLAKRRPPHIVLDPILRSSSGTDLLDPDGVRLMKERLLPLAEVVTPNIHEAGALTGLEVKSLNQMRDAASRLHTMGAANVVVTGGHLERATDLLSIQTAEGIEQKIFDGERLTSNSTHGTGCAFSTALACQLALGRGLEESVRLAKGFIAAAIAHAYPVGKGKGPLNHLWGRAGEES